MRQKLLFGDPPIPTEDRPRGRVYCPACGYNPVAEAMEDNRKAEARGVPWLGTSIPETWEESLEFFDVAGADEGNVFCPQCLREFNPRTGVVKKIDLDKDD